MLLWSMRVKSFPCAKTHTYTIACMNFDLKIVANIFEFHLKAQFVFILCINSILGMCHICWLSRCIGLLSMADWLSTFHFGGSSPHVREQHYRQGRRPSHCLTTRNEFETISRFHLHKILISVPTMSVVLCVCLASESASPRWHSVCGVYFQSLCCLKLVLL